MAASVGRLIANRYRLDSLIGQGGMGSVFKAFDILLTRPVAVKIIHGSGLSEEETRVRLLREARVAAQIHNVHVVAVYDVGAENDEVYLVQEFLSGRDLSVIVKHEGPLEPRRAVRLAVHVCDALSAIHGMGAIHRDIKPSNLFLAASESGPERAVLIDFGISKVLKDRDRALTGPVGTPTYMAPEQVQGLALDARTDLYALGVTLFELIAGAPPFAGGESVYSVLLGILQKDPPDLPGDRASSELQAVVRRCLAKAPADRFSSAMDLMEALLATPEGRAGYVPPSTPPASDPVARVSEDHPAIAISADAAPTQAALPKLSSELSRYLAQAGFMLDNGPGPLFSTTRRPDCRLPPMILWAILLEPEDQPLSAQTMATIAFQKGARPLYTLEGSAGSPHHVLALFRSPPGAGVYREWHELATRKHVYVSPVSPSALRAAVEENRAGAHLQELLRRGRRDPFELEGRIVADLDFFGGRDDLQAFLHLIDGAAAGIGLLGLEKWGTTSLLFRARAELGDRASAWIDLAALPSLSLASVLSAIYEELRSGLVKRNVTAPIPLSALHGDIEAPLLHVLEACQAAARARPVIFLDRVDELESRERCSPEALIDIARALYRLALPQGERAGAVLVFGGREAHVLSSRTLGAHHNPLWGAVPIRYASFFSREEMGDFMRRLGALGGLSFSAAALDTAFELTFGHKYLSRRLGSMLYQRGSGSSEAGGEMTPARVSACASALVTRHHSYFDAVLRRGPPALRDVLARLATAPATIDDLLANEASRASGDPLAAIAFASAYGLVVEEQDHYRLTMGLFQTWLRWTHDPKPKPERHAPPSPLPTPSASEIRELEALIREGFSSPGDLELLCRRMHVTLTSVVRVAMPLPNQIGDLIDWAVNHRRFEDLVEAVYLERPNFRGGGVGQTLVIKVGAKS
jgi:serine/threonine protein kinase